MNNYSGSSHYRTSIVTSMADIGQYQWDKLLASQTKTNPFLSYAFLDALHESGSASAATGWQPQFLCVWLDQELVAAVPMYLKSHSYGEYVFDWAWADAYQRNGFAYYPKLLSAIPFTPVSGNRLLAVDAQAQSALIAALIDLQKNNKISSTHILFPTQNENKALEQAGFLTRKSVQFHWTNQNYLQFEDYLCALDQKKRKNIRAERRKVADAGVQFHHIRGTEITADDWHFFKRCYDQTYLEHRSTPYLNLDFFLRIGVGIPQHIHMIVAILDGRKIASSLLIYDTNTVYGRYWGAIEHVSCLHFETAYYQAIDFCIKQKIHTFEGGAQGEHKLARGFLPHATYSCHSLAEPAFYDAVARFLDREAHGIDHYINELESHTPFKKKI